jgi:hypothetical protein
MLSERVAAFVAGESRDSFEELALAVFRAWHERSASYRELCTARGVTPDRVTDWREVPALPVPAGATAPGRHLKRSAPGQTDLRRLVIDHSFPDACLRGMSRPAVLSLVPPADGRAPSSETLLVDHVLSSWATHSTVAAATRGVEVAKARSFLAARQRDRLPTLILGNTAALARLLEGLELRGLRFRLPAGSRVVESDARATGKPELLARLAEWLAVPAESVVRLYEPGEMPTPHYAGHGRDGEPRPFRPPPWVRVRILDPSGGAAVSTGETGRVAVFDLAGLDDTAHVLTGDAGMAGEAGFHLVDNPAAPTA